MKFDIADEPFEANTTYAPFQYKFSCSTFRRSMGQNCSRGSHRDQNYVHFYLMHNSNVCFQMDGMRNRSSKDKSYKNVFKGSVLVSTLLDHDSSRFTDREAAVRFAQKLLDAHHIESIVGSQNFEDSVHLYRWKDETVVKEAKKMVSNYPINISNLSGYRVNAHGGNRNPFGPGTRSHSPFH